MKIKKLASFLEDIKKLNLTGKVAYAIAKNRKILETEIETLQESIKAREDFTKYNTERIELAKKHARKDEKGNPLTKDNGGKYDIEDIDAFEKEFETLKETHKEAIDYRQKQIEDFNAMEEEESKIVFHMIEESEIPENATAQEVYTLLEFTK
jgi:hypothetical protein